MKTKQVKLTNKQITARKSMLEAMMESLATGEMVERRIKALEWMKRDLVGVPSGDHESISVVAVFVKFCDTELEMLRDIQKSNKRLGLALGCIVKGME